MSAIAAVVAVNPGAPLPGAGAVARMLADMPERAPHGTRVVSCGPAVVGHGLFHVLPEDGPGRQPATSPDGTMTVVIDGRIDNRGELLALAGSADIGQSDAAVLAAALAAAGDRVWALVEGDFAALAWDAGRRRFQAMRDVFGLRPLHLAWVDDCLYVASELRALAGLVPRRIDEGFFGELLAGRVTTRTATPITAVARLEPGHVLTVTATEVRRDRVVVLGGRPSDRRPLADLEAEFLDLLDAAVSRRLRRSGGAGVLLSAGLDSTTVLGRAQRLDPTVSAFTVDLRATASETPGAAATARHWGISHRLAPGSAAAVDYAMLARRLLSPPPHPSAANGIAVRQLAAGLGCRVLLNGLGGDEFFSTNRWACADLLRAGRLVALGRAWRRFRRAFSPESFWSLLAATIGPLLPAVARPLARAVARAGRVPRWVDPRWAAAVDLEERLRAEPQVPARSIGERVRLLDVLGGPSIVANEECDRVAVLTGVDDRAPYFDRRLAAFALALPDALVATAPEPKAFVRQAARAWLPPGVQAFVPPLNFQFLLAEALEAIGGRAFFQALRVLDAGWVARPFLQRAVAVAWPDGRTIREGSAVLPGLWDVASAELCLRAVTA